MASTTAVWETYGKNFYLPVMDLRLNSNDARLFCEKEGGDLTSIEFGGENDYLQGLAAASRFGIVHIGLYYDDWWN